MRRKVELEGDKTVEELSEEFYNTAEDLAQLEFDKNTDFKYYGNACMLAAR